MLARIFKGNATTIIILYALLICLLVFTDPYNLPTPLLFLPFILFFIATTLLVYRLIGYIAKKLRLTLPPTSIARTSFVLSGLPTFLVLLQSIGQVGLYDIIISIILFAALDFYLARSKITIFDKTS